MRVYTEYVSIGQHHIETIRLNDKGKNTHYLTFVLAFDQWETLVDYKFSQGQDAARSTHGRFERDYF